jgi:hypothetical protein
VAGLGILIGWFGYSVGYYGFTQITGGNWGYLDLIVPGRWTPTVAKIPRDANFTPGGAPVMFAKGNVVSTPSGPVTLTPAELKEAEASGAVRAA